ncbi:MAG: putative lipoprotein [Betaproteobacteria bacterium]|nr:putative lipoprotein [Betaproteobacteria bacterium]
MPTHLQSTTRTALLCVTFAIGIHGCGRPEQSAQTTSTTAPAAAPIVVAPPAPPPVDPEVVAKAALQRCDELASDPGDPNRFAPGVTEERFAPGAAIEACQAAVRLNSSVPRANYELGRAYWISQKDSLGLDQFVLAAKSNYAPAFKAIGDAYLQGRGLPSGEQRDTTTAMKWYERGKAAGHALSEKALDETKKYLASITFDPNLFQSPESISRLYNNNYAESKNPVWLAHYTRSFVETLNSETVLFIKPECKPLITKVGLIVLDVAQFAAYIRALNSGDDFAKGLLSHLLQDFAKDEGHRDAIILMNKYGCDNPVTLKIADNIIFTTKQFR